MMNLLQDTVPFGIAMSYPDVVGTMPGRGVGIEWHLCLQLCNNPLAYFCGFNPKPMGVVTRDECAAQPVLAKFLFA